MTRLKIRPARKASERLERLMLSCGRRLAREEYIAQLSPEDRADFDRIATQQAEQAKQEMQLREKQANSPMRVRALQHVAAWRTKTPAPAIEPGFFKDWWK